MHALHCILVRLPEDLLRQYREARGKKEKAKALEDLIETARSVALSETERYYEEAFDWREESAGRWAGDYPYDGVILGVEDPEGLLRELQEWSQRPLQNALDMLEWARSAAPVELPGSLEDLIRFLWETSRKKDTGLVAWRVYRAVELAAGRYTFDSQFYSVPDYSPALTRETEEKVQKNPEEYALVFLDYHY